MDRRLAFIAILVVLLVGSSAVLAYEPPYFSLSNEERKTKWAELDQHWKDAWKFDNQGKLGEALQAGERALDVAHELYGDRGSKVLAALSWVAEQYEYLGKFPQARQLRTQALDATRKTFISTIISENWEVVDARVRLENVEVLKKLSQRQLGRLHSAKLWLAMARRLSQAGETEYAVNLARSVIATRKDILGQQHYDYADAALWMGYLLAKKQPEQSARLLAEALAINRNVFGDEHPATRATVDMLAPQYIRTGEYDQAERLCRATAAAAHGRLVVNRSDPEQKQLALKASLRHRLDLYLTVATLDHRYTSGAYENLIAWKGMVLRQQQVRRGLSDNPELEPLFRELAKVDQQLAGLSLSRSETEDGQRKRRIEQLSERRDDLQRQLTVKSVAFHRLSKRITLDDVCSALPAKSALVDFIEYWAYSPLEESHTSNKPPVEWERRLLAFVIRGDSTVRLIDLTDVATLESNIDAWRSKVSQAKSAREEGQWLHRTVWQPLQSSLAGVEHVLVSPDGAIGRLPLPALPGTRAGTFLLEEQLISIVPSAAGLVYVASHEKRERAAKNLLALGGIDYDASPTNKERPSTTPASSGAVRGNDGFEFQPLLSTTSELSAITKLYRDRFGGAGVTTLGGEHATENTLRREAARHAYLHLATHGYFAPPSIRSALDCGQAPSVHLETASSGVSPEQLSGLALTGANKPNSNGADGILTAIEVRALDLRGVELTVLSACDTGLGKVAGGEGLLGLQRAFQIAGARAVIASLWKVPDAETRDLMVRFYDNLWSKGMDKAAALREAQLWMLNGRGLHVSSTNRVRQRDATLDDESIDPRNTQGNRLPPYYWAAFVLSGDWR